MRERAGMRKGSRLLLSLIFLLAFLPADCSHAGGGPKNVLLVVNDNSPTSQSIAAYYKSKRHIPDRNVCHITCSPDEPVSKTECETNVVAPIRDFIENSGIHNRIDYIVLTKDIPLKASYNDGAWYGPLSVSSVLTCVGAPSVTSFCTNPYGPTAYPAAPVQYFTHQLSFYAKSYYAVAVLDAYTEDQVHRMIDDSVGAQPRSGLFLLDGRYESDSTSNNYKANSRLRQANHDLMTAGYQTYYNDTTFDSLTTEFVGGQQNVMGYFSWGSNESSYTLSAYTSNRFAPGSIADSYVSSSARSFAYPPTYGQSLMSDLIPQGMSGGNGYASEPDVRYATYPNIVFSRYTQGYNMAESFLAATPRLYWKSVIIGDPLMAPYATPPVVTITSPAPSCSAHGQATISATATDASGIKKVEFYVDDSLLATVTAPPYQCSWDTTTSAEGSAHTLDVIAYENSNVFTQGMATAQCQVRNIPVDVPTISHLSSMPVGSYVRLKSKVVIAGADAFVDCAYIAEQDRSAGIRVIGRFDADTGSLVDVEGDLCTLDGEPVILANSVTDPRASRVLVGGQSIGEGSALDPLGMSNRYVANRGSNTGPEYAGLVTGLSNIFLLVRTWGRVTKVGTDEFSISDGSLDLKNALVREIKVSLKNMAARPSAPPLNSYVLVAGVSCYTTEDGLKKPTVRPRSAADIVQVPL